MSHVFICWFKPVQSILYHVWCGVACDISLFRYQPASPPPSFRPPHVSPKTKLYIRASSILSGVMSHVIETCSDINQPDPPPPLDPPHVSPKTKLYIRASSILSGVMSHVIEACSDIKQPDPPSLCPPSGISNDKAIYQSIPYAVWCNVTCGYVDWSRFTFSKEN